MSNQALAAVSDVPAAENVVTVPAQGSAECQAPPEGVAGEAGSDPWKSPGYRWRWPSPLEVSRCAAGLTVAATVSGFVPDGPSTVAAAVGIAAHSAAELVAACFRRTRR
ncbi:hypothetical protein ACFYY2_32245 [Streptomyces sp. NPDC001822]|uniref:hypothetical protein n=1 Tax=Streptomyces sp. NPDC001822 TaxID=3364614 RepID=UPI0036CCF799